MNILLVVVGLIVLFCFVLCYHWRRRHLYKHAMKMDGPFAAPLLGNMLLFIGDNEALLHTIDWLVKTYGKSKKGLRVWFGPLLAVIVSKPEELDVVLNHPNAIHKAFFYDYFVPVLGLGVFTIRDAQKWKMHRKYVITTFNQKVLNSYVEVFAKSAVEFTKSLESMAGKGDFDIFHYAHYFTTDSIIETVMGLHKQNGYEDVVKWLDYCTNKTFLRLFRPWLYPDIIFHSTPSGRKTRDCYNNLRKFGYKLVAEKRKEYLEKKANKEYEDGSKLKSSLELLIEVSEEGNSMTDAEIHDEVMTLLIGGSDSSAIMSSFALMMLGMHPQIQDEVVREQLEIFGDSDRNICVEDLPQMKLLERVIKETMRLFPLAPVMGRHAGDDIELENYTIPKDAVIGIATLVVHRNPDIWTDPLKFDPDRFLPENFAKIHPFAYLPFSGGPRNCIGPKFAMMSMKCSLSEFIRKYRVFCNYKNIEDIAIRHDVMIRAVKGNIISIENRK